MKRTKTFEYKTNRYWYAISGLELPLVVMSVGLFVCLLVGLSIYLFVEKIKMLNSSYTSLTQSLCTGVSLVVLVSLKVLANLKMSKKEFCMLATCFYSNLSLLASCCR